ncbi:MAG: hypothetical protein E6J20_04320 [Chloroflexi bacterium]|nr:MAG: hypothetical protein E6J20_04320 [Chloroflexota bacterium]
MRPPPDGSFVAGREGRRHFLIDPRRRLGGHGRARRFLISDQSPEDVAQGIWRGLVSALQRHTVEDAVSEMSAQDKEVLTLAYLQGHTNAEIAGTLSVSERTVRRRLSIALAHLDEYVHRSGAWIASIATAALLQVVEQGTRLGRLVTHVRPEWPAGITAGALAIAAVGLAVAERNPATIVHPNPPTAAQIAGLPGTIHGITRTQSKAWPPNSTTPRAAAIRPVSLPTNSVKSPSSQESRDAGEGCRENPTSAPPKVPVRSHSSGAPVTHPSAGGCDTD